MHMTIFPVHFNQGRIKAGADVAEYPAQPIYGIAIKHLAAIFRHKDQMDKHLENAMLPVSYFIV